MWSERNHVVPRGSPVAAGRGSEFAVTDLSHRPSRIDLLPLGVALLGYLTFLFVPAVLNDGDTFLHIAVGRWMLAHGAIPYRDPFSSGLDHAPWTAHEWLAELLFGGAFQIGGLGAVLMLSGAAFGAALGLLGHHLRRWLAPLPTAIALLLAAGCAAPGLLARPHILVLPLLELWCHALIAARERGRPPWRALPVLWLWANMHGGFVLGLGLILPFALEDLLDQEAWARRRVGRWALFLVAATIACAITPFGLQTLTLPFHLIAIPSLQQIGEWQATDFSRVQPIEVGLLAALYVCLSRGVRVPPLRLLILLAVLHLSLSHTRNQLIAGVLGALLLAEPVGRAMPAVAPDAAVRGRSRRAPAVMLAVALAASALRLAIPVNPADGPSTPVSAIASLPPELTATPVLNGYAFGAYLAFVGLRPYVDLRAELYSEAFLANYRAVSGEDAQRLAEALQRLRIGWTIFGPDTPAARAMGRLAGWRPLYADRFAIVHARVAPTAAAPRRQPLSIARRQIRQPRRRGRHRRRFQRPVRAGQDQRRHRQRRRAQRVFAAGASPRQPPAPAPQRLA